MNREQAHNLVDQIFDANDASGITFADPESPVKPERTDGKRVVRTKSTGDRVYLIDPEAKTKQWVTSPEILASLEFELADVEDLEDAELVEYRMAPSIYKID